MRAVALGCGSCLPDNVVTNEALAKKVDTSDAWIVERTGIKERRLAKEGELTSDLATKAAERALAFAGVSAAELDLIIVATTTPDYTFPAVATLVQARLGAENAYAFDQQAVCSGFVFALGTADAHIQSGAAKTVLVIGAETMSRLMDWSDRATCVLFGDGAGAIVLRADECAGDRGILATDLNSDGRFKDLLFVDGGPSSTGQTGFLRMKGREVFRHAVTKLAETAETVLQKGGVPATAVDWVVPHQANLRIIEATAKKLEIPREKIVITVQYHGNTSAASIPLALSQAVEDGRIQRGDLLLMEAMGGGMTWGGALLRW
jgi:3-oxoacyl-[acyl-carrier-protein] synthase-3